MELVSVAALAENRVIGKDGEIPWESRPDDRQQYRDRVMEHPVIIGWRTFDSMRGDLPGSSQIVMTRKDRNTDISSVTIAHDVDEAIEAVAPADSSTGYVIGGGEIYQLFQPHVDRMVLTRIPGEYEGDTYYPEWDEEEWKCVDETEYDEFTLEEWERRHRTDV